MKEIVNKLIENGYEAYIVGGFVRDYLLGIQSNDIDISTNAPIKEIKRIFNGMGRSFDKYFAYHIDIDGYSYDITTFRKEFDYKKNKPTRLEVAPDLKTDLLRRDFTINTFALDKDGKLIDLLGAKTDLSNRIIRTVGNTTRKFNADKTRIIRSIRFACTLNFNLDDDIIKFITKKKTYLLNEVTKEYLKSELDKIFDSNGVDKFFDILSQYDISKHFDIKFDKIKKAYNRYGIWAQVETSLTFSKKESSIISGIRELVQKGDINYVDFGLYNEEVLFNAATILGIESKYQVYKDIYALHSIIDIDADLDLFAKYVKEADIKKAYRQVERSIMEGVLNNKRESIEEYLRKIKL